MTPTAGWYADPAGRFEHRYHDGTQWTDLHRTMEQLFLLGLASGLVTELMPRELWGSLPGGMPYYAVTE